MAANVNADAFIPEIWDAAVYRTLEDNLVARKICRNYSNKVKQAGDTIHFNGLDDPAVTSYAGSVSYETLVSGRVSLLIDKQNYYAFKVTDIEEAMANVDLKGSQAERAGYVLKKACDTDLMSLYSDAYTGNVVTDSTCDATTIISDIGLAYQRLAEQNVNEGDMWMTIPPWVELKLKLAGIKFSINEGINGKGGMTWAKGELGFDIFVTNQVYNSGSAASPVSYCMFGSYNAIGYAEALQKSESMRLEGSFETGVRGLHVYGRKVIKPRELGYMALTYTAETAI
ncbi:MAG: hypothetical protein ACM3PP_06715 [Candidatus Saccharibacteria bacterium]